MFQNLNGQNQIIFLIFLNFPSIRHKVYLSRDDRIKSTVPVTQPAEFGIYIVMCSSQRCIHSIVNLYISQPHSSHLLVILFNDAHPIPDHFEN